MANRTHYLNYYIHLDDKAAFDLAVDSVAASAGYLVGQAPDTVAATYGAVLVVPSPIQRFDPPCLTSGYFGQSANYPTNVAQFTRKSGGWFGIPLLFGDTHTYKWAGQFVYAGAPPGESEVPSEPVAVNMPTRYWVDGFENGGATGSGSGNAQDQYAPVASRHLGGLGFPCRRGSASMQTIHAITESGAAAADRAWERFYIRLRALPQSSQYVWFVSGAVSSNAGPGLRVSLSGQLEAVNRDAGATITVIGTSTVLELNRWYKIDVLYRYGAAPDGFFKVYIGGVQAMSVTAGSLPAGTGITQAQNAASSTMADGSGVAHLGSWDIDDWIGAQLPLGGSNPLLLPARDWNLGSKVVPVRATAFAASNTGNWAGPAGANANDWRFLMQRPVISTLVQGLASASASQRVAVVTDAGRRIDIDPQNLGMVAASAGVMGINATAAPADATIGLKLPGAAEVTKTLTALATTVSNAGRGKLTHAGNILDPITPLDGLELSYTSNSAASAKTTYNLVGQIECVGSFYLEDYVPQTGDPVDITAKFPLHWTNDLHQHPFGDGPWAPRAAAAPSIVVTHCGTYVGNGTSQNLAFRTPPTWIFIRNTATQETSAWYVASPSGRTSYHEATRSSSIPRVYIDPNFTAAVEDAQQQQTLVTIAGNNVAINSNGVTYQYMCWQDAGQRFSECGALWEHASGLTANRITSLNNAEFIPEFLQLLREAVGNATTKALYVKGLGLATQTINKVGVAASTGAIEMAAGSLTVVASSPILQTSQLQFTHLAMRRDDGSEDAGIPNVMQLSSWTGDGTASRTITLGPPTGRRPMWALVVGSNGASRIRDASHTGTTSLDVNSETADASTGITGGGVDSVSVGSALNANTVQYEMLVFPGCSATAGNAGWGVNCESIPVEPYSPIPPYPVPPTEPTEPPVTPGPGGTPNIPPTGTITQCPGPSALVINVALGHIGVSKQVISTTLNTEVSQESTVTRLHFDEDVKKVLRDFPWQFATRYATLELISGPATNQDTVQGYSSTRPYGVNDVVRVSDVDYYCLVAHTGQAVTNPVYWSTTEIPERVNEDWLYAYRVPSDYIFARRIIDVAQGTGRSWDLTPIPFRAGSDAYTETSGLAIIYTDEPNAQLEYTHLSGCASYEGDALFREALSWRHAYSIAPALSRDEKKIAFCLSMYDRLLAAARTSSAQEQQQQREGDVDWIEGRN